MKVEKISEFANKISNVELLKDLIKFLLDKTDEEVDMIKETLDKYNYDELLVSIIININKGRSTEEIVKIVDAVGKCEDRVIATEIATNWYIQKNRTMSEIIDLIKTVDECDDKETALNIVRNVRNRTVQEIIELIETVDECKDKEIALYIEKNEYVQKYRKFQEIIKLIQAVDKCKDDFKALKIAIDEGVQLYRTVSEIIELIQAVDKCEDKDIAECILILLVEQRNRTVQEIIELINVVDTVGKCEDKQAAFDIATNVNVRNRTVQEIIQMIESMKVKTNTKEKLGETLDNINTAEQLKGYFEKLNDNGVNDVTSETIVPVYKPTEKN